MMSLKHYPLIALIVLSACLHASTTCAFMHSPAENLVSFSKLQKRLVFSTTSRDDFASFADSLDESDPMKMSWQDELDELLDPTTDMAKRQIILSDLLRNKNQDIRQAIQQAVQEGKMDALLTPRGKRLQEGSRAVARQVTNDILPNLAQQAVQRRSLRPTPPTREEFSKVTNRIFSALTNQLQRNFQNLQQDLQNDPLQRIPERINEQTQTIFNEALNVVSETPIGLQEPPYRVVSQGADYEIRDYESYQVVSTNMGENYSIDNLSQSGAAFNTLASYIFGANQGSQSMDMTTPVTTTMAGEMRFYLKTPPGMMAPEPLEQDEGKSVYETGNIVIQTIPAARLAVRRFTGFVTKGEIARQKQVLLAALELDGVELDVPHGQTVGHLIFQYNPPYTLPVLRRNEIAVPVYNDELSQRQREWVTEESSDDDDTGDSTAWMDAPSD